MKFDIEKLPKDSSVEDKCHDKLGYYTHGVIKVSPSECILPYKYQFHLENIRNFQVQEEDIFLVTNPKCGTTWGQEMIWLIGNNLDFEGAKASLNGRFPYIEIEACVDLAKGALDFYSKLPSPRYIKSHLPTVLLPTDVWEKKCKIVFILRDPRDAAISNFHHYQTFHGYQGTLEEFLEHTLNDRVIYSPFWEHAIEFWKMKNEPNVLFLRFEEMKQDFAAVLQKTAGFLGKTLSEEDIDKLKKHLSVDSMRDNRAVNYEMPKERLTKALGQNAVKHGNFIREGKTGGWRNVLSPEMVARFQEWTKKKITGTGLEAYYS